MPRHNTDFRRYTKKSVRKGWIEPPAAAGFVASPAPTHQPPPPEAFVPPLPAPRSHQPQPWPLNETEIDLPLETPPSALPPIHYVGTVRGAPVGAHRSYDLDVVTLPGAVGLFGYQFDLDQSLKLCRLLLEAVRCVQHQEITA